MLSASIAALVMLLAAVAAGHMATPWSEQVASGVASLLILVAAFAALFNWGLRAARHADDADRE